MQLTKKERLIFLVSLSTLLAGSLLLMLTPVLVSQNVVQRAWVPRAVELVRENVIGSPSTLVSELRTLLANDVTLPPPGSGYNAGFTVDSDGFGFRNYGSRYPTGDLTATEVWELFGDRVCVAGSADSCLPTPATQLWIDTMNDHMAAGHCAGFTISSYRLFNEQLTRDKFDPAALVTYDITQNVPMMRQIAKDWVLQAAREVWSSRIDGTPRDVVDALLTRREVVDLGVFSRSGGGHSLLAYGLEDRGDGLFHILVYDNNWPGRDLFVEVDYKANTWRYSLGAQNPTADTAAWEGDARTNSLIFIPFEAYNQTVACPFCEPAAEAQTEEPQVFVSLTGDSALLQVTDTQGNQTGHFDEQYLTQIPDSNLVRLKDYMYNDREPILFFNPQTDFTVQVVPRPGRQFATGNLRLGGPGLAIAIEGLVVEAGRPEKTIISPQKQQFAHFPARPAKPVAKIVREQNQTSTLAVTGGAEIAPGEGLAVSLNPASGQLVIGGQSGGSAGSKPEEGTPATGSGQPGSSAGQPAASTPSRPLNLAVVVVNQNSARIFGSTSLPYFPGGTVVLDVPGWAAGGPMQMLIDADGDGAFEQQLELTDQFLGDIVATAASADEIISLLGQMSPYMDEAESAAFLAALQAQVQAGRLNGNDLGQIIFHFAPGLGLSGQDIANFVAPLNLPAAELADFLIELNLDESGLAELVNALNLPPAQQAELLAEIDVLTQVETLMVGIEFFNAGTPTELGEYLAGLPVPPPLLPHLLEELDLPPAELGELLNALALPPEQLVEILTGLNLPAPALAETLSALALPTAALDLLVDSLLLPPAQVTTLAQTLQAAGVPTPSTSGPIAGEPTTGPATPLPATPLPETTPTPAASPSSGTAPLLDATPTPGATAAPTGAPVSSPAASPNPAPTSPPDSGEPDNDEPDNGSGPSNSRPSAANDATVTDVNVPVSISVLANDSDPDRDALAVVSVGAAANGSATTAGSDIIYTPAPGFVGSDTFNYTISDGSLNDTAAVNVTVNGPPLAAADNAATLQDTAVTVGVLANDSDPNGNSLSLVLVGPAGNGVTSQSGNSARYSPAPGFFGSDVFTYTVSDGRLTASAQVNITVNGAPVAVDDTAGTAEETPVLINVLANDTDPESTPLAISGLNPAGHGSVVVSGGQVLYTPQLNFTGHDTFIYQVTDGSLVRSAHVTVTVLNVNDPPDAANDIRTTHEDTPLAIAALTNDTDPDNDPLSLAAVGGAGHGQTALSGSNLVYTPTLNFNGVDVFTYTVTDGSLFDTATATVIVTPVNDDPPVAVDDVVLTPADTPVDILVLANDTDPDNDPLTIVTVGPAITGTLSFFAGSSIISYFPASGFSGVDVFTYTISDGALVDTATVRVGVDVITVTGLSVVEPARSEQLFFLPLIIK